MNAYMAAVNTAAGDNGPAAGGADQTAAKTVKIRSFFIDELRAGGWVGRINVPMKIRRKGGRRRRADKPWQVWNAAGKHKWLPGKGVVIQLKIQSDSGLLRTWPAVLTGFRTVWIDDAWEAEFGISDPLSYLSARPIWGVFKEASPGEILGGALSLAAGVGHGPTLAPALPDMPPVRIKQQLRSSAEVLPYAVAAGEPLGLWLSRLFGGLGLSIGFLGSESGDLELTLRDGRPNLDPVELQLETEDENAAVEVGAKYSTVDALRVSSGVPLRGTVLDNQVMGDARRLGNPGSVENIETSPDVLVDEAGLRATFRGERASQNLVSLRIVSGQPGMLAGRAVRFTNQSVLGATQWQVLETSHLFARRRIRNIASLVKDGFPLRLPKIDATGGVIVSAVIDDGKSERGEVIARDRLGRIPVVFQFGSIATEDSDEAAAENGQNAGDPAPADGADVPAAEGWTDPVNLPVMEPMAGGQHGFVTSHRQGDLCRIAVHSPTHAEIVGFSYRDDRKLGLDVSNASAGVVIRQNTEEWRGFGFWPDRDLDTAFDEDDNE